MDEEKKEQGRKCFIITPIGNENSDTFRKAKGVIESVIKPVLTECGFDDIKPAYEINVSGMINTQIINRIIDDDLVIVNLTGNNPNVMYELCLRHVVAKPIIHICENGTSLPFDIKDSRTIFYVNDMLGVEELKLKLTDYLQVIDYQSEYSDNPIYNARKMNILLKDVSEGDKKSAEINLLQKIYEKLDNNVSTDFSDTSIIYDKKPEVKKCDFVIYFKDVDKEKWYDVLNDIRESLQKQAVYMVAISRNSIVFQNRGNTPDEQINNIVKKIEGRYGVKLQII